MQVIYHGHSFIEIEMEQSSILIDPFISENPRCDVSLDDISQKNITHIVLTHGHDITEIVKIAQAIGSKVIVQSSILYDMLIKQGLSRDQGMHEDKFYKNEEFSLEFVKATNKDVSPITGVIIEIGTIRIYHAGPTNFFDEMKELKNLDLALLPIGGYITMDMNKAIQAASCIQAKTIVPIMYNTSSVNKADDIEFARQIMLGQYAVPKVLRSGQYVVL